MNQHASLVTEPGEKGRSGAVPKGCYPVTHQHIFSVISTLLVEGRLRPRNGCLRVLDIGCGDGRLIGSLQSMLERAFPELEVEIHGFDVGEHGFNESSQIAGTLDHLSKSHPPIDWMNCIKLISDDEPWNYPAEFFDLAVSNQVLEHVEDIVHFMANLKNCLKCGGQSIHVFPLGHCIQEAHCHVPFAHWIRDFNFRVAWIKLLSRMGIGRYRIDRKILGHTGLDDHSLETAKFIECWTTYRSFSEIADEASRQSLSTSYHFTKNLISAKLRHLSRRKPALRYRRWTWFGLEWIAYLTVRSVTSSTLVMEPLAYDIGKRIAAEKAHKHRGEHS